MNITNFDIDELLGFSDDTNPLMLLVWILPIILFIFYGQQIQLFISANQIKKSIERLKTYQDTSKDELVKYVKENVSSNSLSPQDVTKRIETFIDYFTIMPVDMDPNGIVAKVRHIVYSREDHTRDQVKTLDPSMNDIELTRIQTLLEIASSLHLVYKIVNHLYLTAKKQKNFPMILPLQMILPFIMEEAEALKEAIPAFKSGQPVGDGIGPMVVGNMMLGLKKDEIALQTVYSQTEINKRNVHLLKAKGPLSTVGRPGDAVQGIITKDNKISAIIMIDAALKLEGEESATIAQGFGAAIGGIGTERFQIEDIATEHKIPIYSIVVKQSIKEAITLMTKEISQQASVVINLVDEMIKEISKEGQSVLIIGVGNTVGVSQ